MKSPQLKLLTYLPYIVTVLAISSLIYFLAKDPTASFEISEPGKDGFNDANKTLESINIGEHFKVFIKDPNISGKESWTSFRGINSDNIFYSDISLIDNFNESTPEVLWTVDMGEGHAGAAIYEGFVYVLDYDEDIRADMLRCFSLSAGEEIWRRWYNIQIRRNHGMSRTVPAVTEKFILTIGPRGHVMCLNRENGDFLWGLDIAKEFESEIPLWYTGQCPLIIDDVAIIATGGNALLIGIDCKTGEIIWKTPNPDNWLMSHSSIMPYEFEDVKMFVYAAVGGVVAVAADGDDTGKILWKTNLFNHNVVAPSPVCMPDGKIFLSAGYGAGSSLLQLRKTIEGFTIEETISYKPGAGLSSEQQTPILLNGYMYGIMPKDAGQYRNQFVCVKADNPTQIIWSSGSSNRFGLGPYILANNNFYLLNDDASLTVVRLSTQSYTDAGTVKLFDGFDAWAPIAIADGYMVLRDSETLMCIKIKKHE